MEVPIKRPRSYGFCERICRSFSPGAIKQSDIKVMIGEMMTVSALLSGFAIGMSSKVTDGAIRAYATFLKQEFFGKNSHFCTFDVPAKLPGAPPIKNSYGVPMGDTCSADGCWIGHWQTNDAARELGFEACSLTAQDVQTQFPDYWERIIEDKVVHVHLELGHNTMFIIMTTVCVAFVGSLLRLSIIKRSDKPQEWVNRFYPLVILLACLPLVNFYNFLMLASRVIRIIFYYCDDFVSTECNVTATPGWRFLIHALMAAASVVWLLHLSLPQHDDPDDKPSSGSGGSDTGSVGKLAKLADLYERGVLTDQEFAAAKQEVLSGSAGGPPAQSPGGPSPAFNSRKGGAAAAAMASSFD